MPPKSNKTIKAANKSLKKKVGKEAAQFILSEAQEGQASDSDEEDTVLMDSQSMEVKVQAPVKKTVKRALKPSIKSKPVKKQKLNVLRDEPVGEKEEEEGGEEDVEGEEEDDEVEEEEEEDVGEGEEEEEEEEEDEEGYVEGEDNEEKPHASKLKANISKLQALQDANVLKAAYINRETKVIKNPLVEDQVVRLQKLLAATHKPKGMNNNQHLNNCIRQIVVEDLNYVDSICEEALAEEELERNGKNQALSIKKRQRPTKKGDSEKGAKDLQMEAQKIEAPLVISIPQDQEGMVFSLGEGVSAYQNVHYFINRKGETKSVDQIMFRRFWINKDGEMIPYTFNMSKECATILVEKLPELLKNLK